MIRRELTGDAMRVARRVRVKRQADRLRSGARVTVLQSGQESLSRPGSVDFTWKMGRLTDGHLACVSLLSLARTKEAAMLKRYARLAGLTLLLGVVFVPVAHASTHFSVQIGPWAPIAPVVVAPGPPPGYVWQSGYYVWIG